MYVTELIDQLRKLPPDIEIVVADIDLSGAQDCNWYEPAVGGNEAVIVVIYPDLDKPVLS